MRSLVFLLTISFYSMSSLALAFDPEDCGRPLTQAWAKHQQESFSNHHQLLKEISKQALGRLKKSAGDLSPTETKLRDYIKTNPPGLTHRMPVSRLKAILASGSLQSPLLAKSRDQKVKIFTPPLENDLFGGHSCVFLAVGPPEGRERYGDVLMKFDRRSLSQNSWAALSSGFVFLQGQWPMIIDENMVVTEIDRLSYAATIVHYEDWGEFFTYMIIGLTRNLAKKDGNKKADDLIMELLELKNSSQFWQEVDSRRLGYLEAKVPGEVVLSDVLSIEVPEDKKDEVCAWPEARPWQKVLGCN